MNPMDGACLLQMELDLWCLFSMQFAFNPARTTHACASYSPSSLLTYPANMFRPSTFFANRLLGMCNRPSTSSSTTLSALLQVSYPSFLPILPGKLRNNLLLNSVFFAFSSLTRLARIDAYSFYKHQLVKALKTTNKTHRVVGWCKA